MPGHSTLAAKACKTIVTYSERDAACAGAAKAINPAINNPWRIAASLFRGKTSADEIAAQPRNIGDAASQRCCHPLLHDIKLDVRDTLADHSQRLGRGIGDVDNAPGNVRTAIVDPDRHG